jgi:FtsH-binding integral membrane protein
MSDFNRGAARPVIVDRADMAVDAGLRQFMLGVYNKVALGLVVSAAMAWLTGMFPPVRDLMFKVAADGRMMGRRNASMIRSVGIYARQCGM